MSNRFMIGWRQTIRCLNKTIIGKKYQFQGDKGKNLYLQFIFYEVWIRCQDYHITKQLRFVALLDGTKDNVMVAHYNL